MKTKRQQALLDVIRHRHIETQEELTAVLREAGFAVTQATVSRDIKELRLIKTLGADGRYYYASVTPSRPEEASVKLHTLFHDAVVQVDRAVNIAVVKTISGTAGCRLHRDRCHASAVDCRIPCGRRHHHFGRSF